MTCVIDKLIQIKMKKLIFLLTVLFNGFLHPFEANAQSFGSRESEMGHPLSKVYVPGDYNAHGQNFSITQDKSGIIFLANFAGVLEYDGTNWKTIPTDNISRVSALLTDKAGRVMVGANGEFGFLGFDSLGVHKFISLSKTIRQKILPVIQIFELKDGIYFITKDAWYIWNGKSVRVQKNAFHTSAAFKYKDKVIVYSKDIVTGSDKGVILVDDKSVTEIQRGANVPVLLDVVSVVPLADGNALLLTTNQGFFKLINNRLEVLPGNVNQVLIANKATFATRLGDGTIATSLLTGGILVISQSGEILYPIFPGGAIQDSQVSYMFNDRDGYLWLSLNDGIAKINIPSPISRFDNANGLKGEVTSITRLNGTLYVGTLYGLFNIKNNRVEQVSNFKGSILAFQKSGNSLLIATNRGVVLWQPGGGSQNLTNEFSLSLTISGTNPNRVYVGLQNGVEELNKTPSGWKVTKYKGIDDQIFGIKEDNDQIWLETLSNGLLKINRVTGQVKRYTAADGLTSPLYNKLSVYANKLTVSNKDGIFLYDETKDRFEHYNLLNTKSGKEDSWFDQLMADGKGNVWATRGDKKQISLFQKGSGDKLYFIRNIQSFRPVSDISFQVIYPDENQVAWAGGDQGLYRFDMKVPKNYSYKYPTLIRQLTTANGKVLLGDLIKKDSGEMPSVVIDYKQNNVSIEYALPSYHINQDIQYQLILENYDKGWSEWSTLTHREYNGLPPGNYTFRVRAKDIFNVVSQEAAFSITIATPWYLTWWMIAIYSAAFAFLIYYAVRWRLLAVIKEKQGLENLIRERTEEVVSQKEEFEKQSEQLASSNDQLEKIDDFVKSINAEVNKRKLFKMVLERACLFQNVDSASALMYNRTSEAFQFFEMAGEIELADVADARLTYAQAADRYMQGAVEVHEDIFVKNDFRQQNSDKSINDMFAPKSLITIIIRVVGEVKCFITFENKDRTDAFDEKDFTLVRNLKEHLIGAYIKTDILENLENTLQNLKTTQEELIRQERLASVGQLTKGIVDRILNPLNYINNFSQSSGKLLEEITEVTDKHLDVLSEDEKDDLESGMDMLKKNLDKIYEHGNSTTRIVKDMQKLLKGKSTEFFVTELNPFLESKARTAVQEVMSEYKGATVKLSLELDPEPLKVSLLPYEFSQVITNLISNACYTVMEKNKLAKENFVPEVIISSTQTDSWVRIVVRDNGRGIPAKEIEQLFNPFFTTKPTSKGTGLGLYMSKDIIEYHKGRMSVNSLDGQFTEIDISLPIVG